MAPWLLRTGSGTRLVLHLPVAAYVVATSRDFVPIRFTIKSHYHAPYLDTGIRNISRAIINRGK